MRRDRRRPRAAACDTAVERVDVDGAWWMGYHDGWRDRDDGRQAMAGDEGTVWSSGYRAGWRAWWGDQRGRRCRTRSADQAVRDDRH